MPADSLAYSNLFMWGLLGISLGTGIYATYIGLAQLVKLKLRSSLFLAVGFWFIFSGFILQFIDYGYGSLFTLQILGTLSFVIIAIISALRERKPLQILRLLPLKDRFLGRYPPDLLKTPLPQPSPPRLPPKTNAALILLVVNGVMALASVVLLIPTLLLITPIIPLDPTPIILSTVVVSALLFLGSLLIWMKRYLAGGILGIVFGALTLGVMWTGALGIIGGVFALMSRRDEARVKT